MDSLVIVIIILGLIIFIIWIWIITNKWFAASVERKAVGIYDYAIILGAKVKGDAPSLTLKKRLDAAITYGKKYPHVTFIVSGGSKYDTSLSEADVMKNYLIEYGIAEERLIIENQSKTTRENIENSVIITHLSTVVDGVTLITSDYHLARTKRITEKLGFLTDVVKADTPKKSKMKLILRERIALLKEMAWPL